MTSAWAWGAGAAVLIGLLASGARRWPIPRRARAMGSRDVSILRRLRPLLTVLAAAAGWAFIGGSGGVIVGVVVAVWAWRTLTRARSPSAVRHAERLKADYPLVVELLAGALAVGADVETAVRLVATAVGDPWASKLATSLNALGVGQSPVAVWADLERDPSAEGLGRALGRSHALGVPVADAMARLAQDLREDADLAAQAYARTIEVRAAVPLGLCFLPAFVLLGVVPLVAAVLSDVSWIAQ